MSDDAWEEIQAVKSKRNELRERLQKRRKEREDLLGGTADVTSSTSLQRLETKPITQGMPIEHLQQIYTAYHDKSVGAKQSE